MPKQVRGDVLALHGLAQAMRARRFTNGALRLDNVKLDFRLDADGNPVEAHPHGARTLASPDAGACKAHGCSGPPPRCAAQLLLAPLQMRMQATRGTQQALWQC
jgi:hypothetical protein